MRMFLRTLSVLCAFGLVTALVASAEDKALRERAHELLQKAEQFAEKGRVQEAEKLHHEAEKLLKASGSAADERPDDVERQIDTLHQHLKALHEKQRQLEKSGGNEDALAEIREHREAVEQKLGKLQELHKRGDARNREPGADKHAKGNPHPELEEGGRRLKHMRVAIENLHAAGAHDLAEELTDRANAMERELREAREHLANEAHAHEHAKPEHPKADKKHPGDPVEDLRREVQQLRAELKELRQVILERK